MTVQGESVRAGEVELCGVTVGYEGRTVLKNLSLAIRPGESLVLLGPNGAGKSTIIRIIAGLLSPWEGSVRIAGRDVTTTPAKQRNVGLLFRSYGLFSDMTVAANVAHYLRVAGATSEDAARRAQELLKLVRLEHVADEEVGQLSTGQQQRANLARVLAADPEILLLHEPLSAVDHELRHELGEELRRLQQRRRVTVVLATRDRQDAFVMADRIAVVRDGALEQIADPRTVYEAPKTRYAATLTGEANLLPGRVTEVEPGGATGRATCLLGAVRCRGDALRSGQEVRLLIRPEELRIVPADAAQAVGDIVHERYLGSHTMTMVKVGGEMLKVLSCEPLRTAPGGHVGLALRHQECPATVLPM